MKRILLALVVIGFLAAFTGAAFAETDADYAKAIRYYYSGKFKEAARLLKEYVQKKPDAVAYYHLGYALYKTGKYNEAEECFDEAYLIDPKVSIAKPGVAYPYQTAPGAKPAAEASKEKTAPEAKK